MPISKSQQLKKYTYKSGDLIALGPSIPNSLEPVVANAPKGDQAIAVYLSKLVKSGEITTDDVDFLIDSGALQN